MPSRHRAIFFDRDNTLIVNDGYLGDPAAVVLMPGASSAITDVRQMGFATVIISNQSGVARGLFDEAAVQAIDRRMADLLRAEHPQAVIDLHLYCPFHPDAVVPAYRMESDLRKPGIGMLLVAAKKLKLDLQQSWVIGDAPRDIEAGIAAGCRTILFTPPNVKASKAATGQATLAEFQVSTLQQAVEKIRMTMVTL